MGLTELKQQLLRWLRGEHSLLDAPSHDAQSPKDEKRMIYPLDRNAAESQTSTPAPTVIPSQQRALNEQIAARRVRSGSIRIRCPRCNIEYTKSGRGRGRCPNCGYTIREQRYCWTCMRWIPALVIIHHDDNQFCPLCYYSLLYQRRGRLLLNLIKYPLIVLLIGIPIWLLLVYLKWGAI